MDFSMNEKNNIKIFLQIFHHYFIRLATVNSLQSSRLFQTILLNYYYEMLSLIRKEKLHVKIVVPKLQETILYGTRIDVELEHCIVPSVPISSQNHEAMWITILLSSTVPQNLMSPSSVKFVIMSFQDFMFYVNIETVNTVCRSDPEQEMWMWKT